MAVLGDGLGHSCVRPQALPGDEAVLILFFEALMLGGLFAFLLIWIHAGKMGMR